MQADSVLVLEVAVEDPNQAIAGQHRVRALPEQCRAESECR
jgi:hypothetical protein